jgi:hypothetical protein
VNKDQLTRPTHSRRDYTTDTIRAVVAQQQTTIGQSTGGGSSWTEEYYNWEIKSNSGSDMDSENGSNVEVGDGEDPDAEGKMEVPTGTGTTAVSTWGRDVLHQLSASLPTPSCSMIRLLVKIQMWWVLNHSYLIG